MKRAERLRKEIDSISGPCNGEDYDRLLPGNVVNGGGFSDGEQAERLAIDILTKRAYDDVRGLAKDILQRVLDGEIEGDDLHDAVWEACDSACIYTKDCWMYAWLLRDSDDTEEMDGEFSDQLTRVAFNNLRSEVTSMVEHCLNEADWENEENSDD